MLKYFPILIFCIVANASFAQSSANSSGQWVLFYSDEADNYFYDSSAVTGQNEKNVSVKKESKGVLTDPSKYKYTVEILKFLCGTQQYYKKSATLHTSSYKMTLSDSSEIPVEIPKGSAEEALYIILCP